MRKLFFCNSFATLAKIVLVCIALIFIINACRKIDHHRQNESETFSGEKFFTAHRSSNKLEKTIVSLMQRENNKYHFAEAVQKAIGVPYWDKMIRLRYKTNSGRGSGGDNDSTTFVLVPFVRELEDPVSSALMQVNSVLMFRFRPNDTSFKYVCDWQYHDMTRGVVTIDSSAERFSLFFMYFDSNVFGYNKFNIKDTSLFSMYPKSQEDSTHQIGLWPSVGPSGRQNRLSEMAQLCVEGYVCGTPTWCSEYHPPCDYQNCPTSQCYGWEECIDVEIIGGGGGDGGDNGGWIQPGGGEGGGGNGGGWNPPICNGGHGKNLFVDPCSIGWVPVPDEEPPNSYPLPPYVINNLTKPCLKAALNKLSGGINNTFFKQIFNIFDTSTNFHLSLNEANLNSVNAYGTCDTMSISNIGFVSLVTMDTVTLMNCSQEWMAYVFIHEVAHAGMFTNIIQWDTANSQHEAMMTQYLSQMATALIVAYPGLTSFDTYAMCYAGYNNAIDGITANPALLYIMLKEIKRRLNNQSITAQQLISRGEEYTELGTKGIRSSCN